MKTPARSAANEPRALAADELRWRCRLEDLGFESSSELDESAELHGQARAGAAIDTALAIDRDGFNLFVFGPAGTGRHSLVRESLAKRAPSRSAPRDLCYIHNFQDEHRPRLLRLPAGRGLGLARDLDDLVRDLSNVLPAAFESEDFQHRRKALDEVVEGRQSGAWERIAEEAKERGLSVIQSPVGLMFAPLREEKVLSPEEFQKLPQEERERLETEVERLKGEVEKVLLKVPGWMRERRQRQEELEREVAQRSVSPLFADRRGAYAELEPVLEFLAEIEQDVVARARQIAQLPALDGQQTPPAEERSPLRRYRVNVLVGRDEGVGAPIVEENHPTLANLVGRVEHFARQGALFTDFTLIKPGALHRADGGYLVLDAGQVLRQPLAWEALKRALSSRQVKIESAAEALSLTSTVTLEPEPAPLEVKVVLVGEPEVYYLLSRLDPEFPRLFKIGADFAVRARRTPEATREHARLLAGMARRERLRPLAVAAIGRLLEHGARRTGDGESLSLELGALRDVLEEADHLAATAGKDEIDRAEVEAAIAARVGRADRLREEIQREIGRGTLRIETGGVAIGQVNGLAVIALDSFRFGHPVRITARARLGEGKVVDIEREVELGGPLHSKGVLILSGFLGERYVPTLPLSLQATLVFEQSYQSVEGDSASLAELCALLSAIGGLPLRQDLAITGSVDQHGVAQAIGGVNEKIEGFFDVCRARGLSGTQGVLIPATNVEHLMLREDVLAAASKGEFHVWAVADVDQAMTLLAGRPAGQRDAQGSFPDESVNGEVETRLVAFALQRMALRKGELLGEVATSDAGRSGKDDAESDGGGVEPVARGAPREERER